MSGRVAFVRVLVLILIVTWIGLQRRAIGEIEDKTAALQKAVGNHLAFVRDAPVRNSSSLVNSSPGWSKSLQAVEHHSDGLGERALLRLGVLLVEMSAEEIGDALDELATLDLTGDQLSILETRLIDRLIEESPQQALERFKHRIVEGNMIWKWSRAFASWAKDDPAAAIAWFDREIASGTFDSRSLESVGSSRLSFEAAMAVVLLDSDPASAVRRVKALPSESYRMLFLRIVVSDPNPGGFTHLVRSTHREKDTHEVLGTLAKQLRRKGGYDGVDQLIEGGRLTLPERKRLVEDTAKYQVRGGTGSVKISDIDGMREWVRKWLPDAQDRLTGEALAWVSPFETASSLALRFHEKSATDEVLAAFLEGSAARGQKEQALPLVERIADRALKEQLRESLAK